MSQQLRTFSHLLDYLDTDFSWRLKEIADLKIAVRTTDSLTKKTLIRAAVPLLYAHWEGFVKNASLGYLDFINNQGHSYNELVSCFIVFGIKKKLNDMVGSKKASTNISAINFILQELGQKAQLKMKTAVDTESNLGSSVFENIAISIGIDPSPYKTKYKLIDESLLKRRNNIAHGEYLDIGPDEYRELADEIIFLLRCFKADIENAASTAKYRRAV